MKKNSKFWAVAAAIFMGCFAAPVQAQHTVSVTEHQNCAVEISPQKDKYDKGDKITVTLTVEADATFDTFEVYYECTEAEYWAVQFSSAKNNGIMSAPRRASAFAYRLEIWNLDGYENDPVEVSEGKKYTFTMPDRNIEIEAFFNVNNTEYDIARSETTNGTVSIDKWKAKAGDIVNITATPADGYTVDAVKVFERETSGNAIYETPIPFEKVDSKHFKFTMPAKPVRVQVTFKALPNALEIKNDKDNTEAINTYVGQNTDVILSGRTLYKDNTWNTICLPFDIDDLSGTPLEGATVKTLASSSFDNNTSTLTINFSTVTEIKAGMPYIVKWESGENITDPMFSDVTIKNTVTTNEKGVVRFVGTFSPFEIKGENKEMLYMGADNKLYYPNGSMVIGSCRAYFMLLNGVQADDIINVQSASSKIVVNYEDVETTGIEETRIEKTDNAWYTIDGYKVEGKPSKKGLYIHNGRKIMIM